MRKGEYNKEVLRLQQLLGRKLRLHAESELQIRFNVEREKVLCDLLLHQEFFEHIRALVAKHLASDPANSAAAGSDSGTTLQDLWQAGAAADASLTDTDPTWLHQQLPDSYVARLLRQVSLQQVHQVLRMTRQDWVDFWTDTSQQLLLLLEVCSRSEYDYDPFSTAATAVEPSATQQLQWSVQQQPLYTSAAANRELLWQAVDSKVQLIELAQVLDPVPYMAALDVCLAAGAGGQPSREHWEAVADRLDLSPMQEAHLSICVTELKRMQAAMRSECVNLLQAAQQHSLQVAAAMQQQHDSDHHQQRQRDAHSSTRFPTAHGVQQAGAQEAMTAQQQASDLRRPDATQATASCHRRLAQQLQAHLAKRQLQLLCTQAFIVNTLTRHQLALITVASLPYPPAVYSVMEIVCSRLHQRTLQQLCELEKGVNRKSSAALLKAAVSGQAGARKRRACVDDDDDDGSGQGPERVPHSQWLREQHDQERAAELLLHQHHCWSQLDRLQHLQ